MPQFFHRRWNALGRIVLYGAPLVALALGGLIGLVGWSPAASSVNASVTQPIAFSHEFHVGRMKLDCRYCHGSVETAAFAGMPSTQLCYGCHEHVWTGLAAVEPVKSSYETKVPLAWKRVHDLPDHAVFNHGIHVQKGIGCVTCHGRVDQMPQVWQTETLYMEWCLECHRQPEKYVRPREEVFNLAWQRPSDPEELAFLAERLSLPTTPGTPEELGAALVEKYGIRQATSCSVCHF